MNTDNTEKTEATGGEIGTFKKVLNAVKRFFLNPANVILVVFLLVLAFMIFYPLFTLIVSTFRSVPFRKPHSAS